MSFDRQPSTFSGDQQSTRSPLGEVSHHGHHAWLPIQTAGNAYKSEPLAARDDFDGQVNVYASTPMLGSILSLLPDQRVQVCDTWQDAIEGFIAGQGGCVLLEIDTDRQHKLDQIRQTQIQWNLLSVVACSAQDNGAVAMAAAKAGCQEFVSLTSRNDGNRNGQTSDPNIENQSKIQRCYRRDMKGEYCRQQFRANWNKLTSREQDVLRRCLDGDNSKSLAKQLTVTYQTIDKHRNRALRKMNCGSLVEFAQLLYQLQSIAT